MIPLFDLGRLLNHLSPKIKETFSRCLEETKFINGPDVKKFEDELSNYLNVSDVIGVSSGTDALLASFLSLGLKKGDEILVSSFTFAASATSIIRAGLTPVFVDLDVNSFHPSLKQYKTAKTAKTRGILAVHLFGEPNNLTELKEFCDNEKLILIEDCAQSLGSEWKNKKVGTYGDISTFSFFPAKNLGCFGDGGAVATSRDDLAEKVKMIRGHGCKSKYEHEILGGNFRLDTIQAAILSILLPELDNWLEKRRNNALYYSENLKDIEQLRLPTDVLGHSWNQYTLSLKKRDDLKLWLDKHTIGNAVYYPKALHHQKVFNTQQVLPEAEKRCKEVISLPIYPGLLSSERDIVVEIVRDFFKR